MPFLETFLLYLGLIKTVNMKYCIIDVETTGTDDKNCQILEIGAVIEDTSKMFPIDQLPKFKCILDHKEYSGSAFAINMNARIFNILADKSKYKEHNVINPDMAIQMFADWINQYYFDNYNPFTDKGDFHIKEPINIGGKNFGVFDKLFLDRMLGWSETIKHHRRLIDPAMLFVDWKNDSVVPDLNKCLERAGIKKEVSHNALEDAIDTLMCLRAKY